MYSIKEFRRALRKKSCVGHASIAMMVSSAYCIIGKSWPHLSVMGNLRSSRSFALLTVDCRRSATKTKGSGDNGSPYLTPLLQWNGLPGTPFRSTTNLPKFMIILIQIIHLGPNTSCCRNLIILYGLVC
jgi:hypothetical protein